VDRTLGAAALAAAIVFAAVAGIGVFLGFATAPSLVSGAVAGLIAAALTWGAARRAASFEDDVARPVRPGFPGEPDPEDEDDDRQR